MLIRCFCFIILGSFAILASGQTHLPLPLDDLSSFEQMGKDWRIVASAQLPHYQSGQFETQKGSGVLVGTATEQLATTWEHADLALELDFMLARKSKATLLLQGHYAIQLSDSWGTTRANTQSCGTVNGHAPRTEACRAPGLWQHLRVVFQAARFDDYGQLTAPARLVSLQLNGQTLQTNLLLDSDAGQNRGSLILQGGPIAVRHIQYARFDARPPYLSQLRYEHYKNKKDDLEFKNVQAVNSGPTQQLTHEVANTNEKLGLRFTGQLTVARSGQYVFEQHAHGQSSLRINDQLLFQSGNRIQTDTLELKAGTHRIDLRYSKMDAWYANGLGLYLEGPGIRRTALHSASSLPPNFQAADPIHLDFEATPILLRSFVDIQTANDTMPERISHAISVGLPEHLAYSYDLETGALLQVWKNAFLDVTPMWHDRGDGSSRPLGSPMVLSKTSPVFSDANDWAYRTTGYLLDEVDAIPTFQYSHYGKDIEDRIAATADGNGIARTISWKGNSSLPVQYRLAEAKDIQALSDGLYRINNAYYLQLPPKLKPKPALTKQGTQQRLSFPLTDTGSLSYQIIW